MKNKKKWFFLAGLILIAIILIVLSTYFLFYQEYRLTTAVNNGDTEFAINYFEKHMKDNPQKVEKYRNIFSTQVEKIFSEYEKENIEFDVAEQQLKTIVALNIVPRAKTAYDDLLVLNELRKTYQIGNEFFEAGKYKEAIIEYSKMQEIDDYQAKKVELAKVKYKEEAKNKFSEYLSQGNYDLIDELFEEMKSILAGDDPIFEELSQKVILNVRNFVDDGNVGAAREMLEILQGIIEDDEYYSLVIDVERKQNEQNEIKALNFLKGKWKRMNMDSDLYGMIVQVSDGSPTVGRIIYTPNRALSFHNGDTKWSSIYVEDSNTVHISDLTKKSTSNKGTLYGATMKLNYKTKTISITYDIVDGSTNGQIQSWTKID